jgi:hypothetical protein
MTATARGKLVSLHSGGIIFRENPFEDQSPWRKRLESLKNVRNQRKLALSERHRRFATVTITASERRYVIIETLPIRIRMLATLLLGHVLSYTKGYHTFTVKHDRPFAIALKKNLLVFALDEPPSRRANFAVVDRHNQSISIPFLAFTHIYFFDTTILVSVPPGTICVLHYWLLPTSLCNSISFAAVADHRLSFRLNANPAKTDFCIFSQSGAASYTAILDYYSASPRNRIEFYTSSVGPDRQCKRNGICKFKANRPFFIRIANITGFEFDASITLWALRRSTELTDCRVQPIPIVIEPPVQIPIGAMLASDITCVSMAEDVLKYIGIGIGVFGVAFVVLVVLHRMEYINVRALFGCTKEMERFNALKEHPWADPLPGEAEPPIDLN